MGSKDIIITELVPGRSLQDYCGRLSLDRIACVAKQALEFLSHSQEKGIIHGDLKPNNFILNECGHLTAIDMGLSQEVSAVSIEEVQALSFRALEVIVGKNQYDTSIDMWSLACILFLLYTGEYLFFSAKADNYEGRFGHLQQIIHQCGMPRLAFLKTLKKANQYFLFPSSKKAVLRLRDSVTPLPTFWKETLLRVSEKRKDSPDTINAFIDLIENMLLYENRITPQEALRHPFVKRDRRFSIVLKDPLRSASHVARIDDPNGTVFSKIDLSLPALTLQCLHIPQVYKDRYRLRIYDKIQGTLLSERCIRLSPSSTIVL
jgi:serine/threonine protein kinase